MADVNSNPFDPNPVLTPHQVSDLSSGYDAFAKTLGELSQTTAQKAVEINKDQSQAMYIHSVSNIEQLKTGAEMQMIEHPDQAPKIADNMQTAVDQVKQAAFVNDADRNKLSSYADSSADEIALKGAMTSVKQAQLGAAFTHYANWPDQLKAYQQSLMSGDDTQAKQLENGMIGTLHSLVKSGAITPEQAGSSLKSMHLISDNVSSYTDLVGKKDTTAQEYHTAHSSLLGNSANNVSAPVEHNTQWLVDHYSNDHSFQGAKADISNGMLPNAETWMSLSPKQQDELRLVKKGRMEADGMINSNQPFSSIVSAADSLNTKGKVLSYADESKRNALNQYIASLKNGDYLSVVGATPAGGRIMQDYINRKSALENLVLSGDAKQRMQTKNENDLVTNLASLGYAQHIPAEYIKPIPKTDTDQMEAGFQLNQDPKMVIQTLGKYSQQNQAYAADSLKNPNQKIIAQAVSLAPSMKPQDAIDLIAANQQGRSYDHLAAETDRASDSQIKTYIGSELSDQLRMQQYQNGNQDGQTMQKSMIDTTLNLTKYIAVKNGDLSMVQWRKWSQQASEVYKNSFAENSGLNYRVNPNSLPEKLSDNDLSVLSSYAIAEGSKYLNHGVNDATFYSMFNRNNLTMRFSSTGRLQAVDSNGQVYFDEPYTSNLLPAARKMVEQQDEKNRKLMNSSLAMKTLLR